MCEPGVASRRCGLRSRRRALVAGQGGAREATTREATRMAESVDKMIELVGVSFLYEDE